MSDVQWSARLPRMSPVRAFATIFMGVFLFIFGGGALITYLMTPTYRATAHVIAPDAAHIQLLESTEFLKELAHELQLPEAFGALYGENKPLPDDRVENLLRRSIRLRRVPDTRLVEIQVYDRSPDRCAQLANSVAELATRKTANSASPIAIVIGGHAVAPLKPARPNKVLNLVLAALVGIFLGTMAGGVGAKLAVGFDGKPRSA